MKLCCSVPSRSLCGLLLLFLLGAAVARAQVNCTILVHSLDTGFYDVFGEYDSEMDSGITGLPVQDQSRGPLRSFLAFHVPPFPGTLLSASVEGTARSFGPDDAQTLQLVQVTNSADRVRRPGFFATDIYGDLGNGIVYGSHTFPSGYSSASVSLNANGQAAIVAARGQDFVMGGTQPVSFEPVESDFIEFPYSPWSPANLRLEVSAPHEPFIYQQPVTTLLYSNDSFLTVGVCGAEPLTYTWYVHGTNHSSALGSQTLYLGWIYTSNFPVFVVVTNSFGSVTSSVVTVLRPPTRLLWNQTNLAVRSGTHIHESLQFSWNGSFPTFTWRKNGTLFENIYFNSLNLPNTQPSDSGDYTIIASNSFGVATSAVMRLEVVDVAPRFWEQPRSTTNALGDFASFRANAPGGPPPTFRWYRPGVLMPPDTNNSAYLPLNPLKLSDAGNYYVVASNRAGMATSAVAHLEVILDPPVFTVQPQSQVTFPGHFMNLTVGIDGSPYPELQWYFNGSPIPGARYANLPLGNVSVTSAGDYFCVASNASGVATSEVASLSVIAVPPIVSGPNDATAPAGQSVFLSVIVSNPPAQVRWFADAAPPQDSGFISSGPNQPTTFGSTFWLGTSNYTAQFFVVASNEFGVTTSRVASITVTTAPPVFVSQPADITALEGSTVVIPNYTFGAPPPRQFLYRNGRDAGAFFNGSLYLFNVTPAQSGEYVLVASNHLGTATSAPFRINVLRVGPLDRWTRRHPSPQGNDLHALTFGQSRYVACGDVGTIITSTNATNWNVFSAEVPAELEDLAYGNGLFVVVGQYAGQAVMVTSTNGETWITQTFTPALSLRGVAYGNGQFLAIGAIAGAQRAFVSSNGLHWTTLTIPSASPYAFDVVAFGNGHFIIADDSGNVNVSSDLITWTNRFQGVLDPEGARFINNQFVISGNSGRLAFSADGLNWTTITNNATLRRLFNTAHGAGLYVAAGVRGTIISSADTTNWALETSPTDDRYEDIIYANGLFVAVGENGTIVTSYDGHQWTEQTRGVAQDLDGIAVSDNLAIAVGKSGTILTSTDGRAWDLAPLPVPLEDSPADWHGVAFGDGKIVVVGDSTNVLVSTDHGASWTPHSYFFPREVPLGTGYLKSVIHTQGIWVAVGIDGDIFTSNDATNWTQQDTPVAFDLNDIAYGNGQFVVVGDSFPSPNATILISTNGTNWINSSYGLGKNARAVTFANGRFVIAANDGRFLTSTNPLLSSWNLSFSFDTYDGANLRSVTAHSNLWLVVGNRGIIVTATNTAGPWKPRLSHTVENLHGVRYFKNAFLAVGNRGVILQSDPIVSQLAIERADGNLRLLFSSPYEGVFKLQSSSDFNWSDWRVITNSLGTAETTVPVPGGPAREFFRVVAP